MTYREPDLVQGPISTPTNLCPDVPRGRGFCFVAHVDFCNGQVQHYAAMRAGSDRWLRSTILWKLPSAFAQPERYVHNATHRKSR